MVLGALVHEADNGLGVDQLRAGQGRGEGEVLEEPDQEEEQLVVSQLLAEAVSLAQREGDEPLVPPQLAGRGINEPLGVEQLGRLPVLRVVHDPGNVGVDRGPGREVVAVALDVLSGVVGRGVGDAGVPEHLVDEGVSEGHPRPVLQRGLAATDHVVNLLLDPPLDLWVSDEIVDGECDDGGGGL